MALAGRSPTCAWPMRSVASIGIHSGDVLTMIAHNFGTRYIAYEDRIRGSDVE